MAILISLTFSSLHFIKKVNRSRNTYVTLALNFFRPLFFVNQNRMTHFNGFEKKTYLGSQVATFSS